LVRKVLGEARGDDPSGVMTVIPWDETTEARNRWIYDQVMSGLTYPRIREQLVTLSEERRWDLIDSDNGIRQVASRYASVHHLPSPPPRKKGRPGSS